MQCSVGRTARKLFWMSRQIERAENMDAARRRPAHASRSRPTPATAIARNGARRWPAPASSTISSKSTATRRSTRRSSFILFDDDNASSVRSCLRNARTNARAVRTKITRDMWEALNSTWLAYEAIKPARDHRRAAAGAARLDPPAHRALPRRAARHDPSRRRLLLQPARRFRRARRQHRAHPRRQILHPAAGNQMIGGEIDTYQWETILRSVSAHRSYRHVFHENYRPWNVADFLILRAEMPRSLRFCYDWLQIAIDGLSARSTARGCPPPISSPRRATC